MDADLLWEDFFAVLNAKEQQIVVWPRTGATEVGEIANANEIGYASKDPAQAALPLGIEDAHN